jgi:hypothetical protein
VVFVSTHAPLRGLWEWVAVLIIALVVPLIAVYGLWGKIRDWFMLLHVQISMAGYAFLCARPRGRISPVTRLDSPLAPWP